MTTVVNCIRVHKCIQRLSFPFFSMFSAFKPCFNVLYSKDESLRCHGSFREGFEVLRVS